MFAYDFVQVIIYTRCNARREGNSNEDQEVPTQGNQIPFQVSNDPQVGNVPLEEFRASMNLLAQAKGRWCQVLIGLWSS